MWGPRSGILKGKMQRTPIILRRLYATIWRCCKKEGVPVTGTP